MGENNVKLGRQMGAREVVLFSVTTNRNNELYEEKCKAVNKAKAPPGLSDCAETQVYLGSVYAHWY